PSRHIHRADFEGCDPRRFAGSAPHQIGACAEYENRQVARTGASADISGACRRGNRMRRREFVAGLGAVTWRMAARARRRARPVIGYLGPDVELPPGIAAAFQQGLSETGYRNAVIEYRRSSDGDKLATLAAETVVRRVNVIFSVGVAATAYAIKASAGTIPI